MGKQLTKSRKAGSMGKGKVTPVQIAFIVDRYLADNNYTNTRSTFRIDASHLISGSPVQEAPRSLLSLGEMLDEYVMLKEQKVMLDQEKRCFEQEKLRVQTLLKGMQDVMNVYTLGTPVAAPPPLPNGVLNSATLVSQVDTTGSSSGFLINNTPAGMSASTRPFSTPAYSQNFATRSTNLTTSKRRISAKDVSYTSVTAKRSRSQSSTKLLQGKDSTLTQLSNVSGSCLQHSSVKTSTHANTDRASGSPVQGSSVAKCLFNQPSQSPPISSPGLKTPPRATSLATEKSISTPEVENATSSNDVTPQQLTSTNCTVIASETITVSPSKQMAFYSIERNCRISSSSPIKANMKRFSKRDHVKGKLDFYGSGIAMNSDNAIPCEAAPSETEKQADCFDFDLPSLEIFGPDFSFSELLGEFDIDGEGTTTYSHQPEMDSSSPNSSGSPHSSEDAINGANQVVSEHSSTVTQIISEKNTNIPGKDSVTSMKTVTKCIKIVSPVKNQQTPSKDHENISASNLLP